MKKTFNSYIVIWAILLALFNVIVFVSPSEAGSLSKFGGAFWSGYIFITLAFVGQLAVSFIAFKAENPEKFFYKLPLVGISYTGLVLTLSFSDLCVWQFQIYPTGWELSFALQFLHLMQFLL